MSRFDPLSTADDEGTVYKSQEWQRNSMSLKYKLLAVSEQLYASTSS